MVERGDGLGERQVRLSNFIDLIMVSFPACSLWNRWAGRLFYAHQSSP
jgi:hypothetical protein